MDRTNVIFINFSAKLPLSRYICCCCWQWKKKSRVSCAQLYVERKIVFLVLNFPDTKWIFDANEKTVNTQFYSGSKFTQFFFLLRRRLSSLLAAFLTSLLRISLWHRICTGWDFSLWQKVVDTTQNAFNYSFHANDALTDKWLWAILTMQDESVALLAWIGYVGSSNEWGKYVKSGRERIFYDF